MSSGPPPEPAFASSWNLAVAAVVVLVGLARVFGFVTGLDTVQNFGVATVASPLPLVFTDQGNYEDFATEIELDIALANGARRVLHVTPQLRARLQGPDDRVAVYTTVAGMTPFLGNRAWTAVLGFGFCANGPLAQGLELEADVESILVRVSTKTVGRRQRWNRHLPCDL